MTATFWRHVDKYQNGVYITAWWIVLTIIATVVLWGHSWQDLLWIYFYVAVVPVGMLHKTLSALNNLPGDKSCETVEDFFLVMGFAVPILTGLYPLWLIRNLC